MFTQRHFVAVAKLFAAEFERVEEQYKAVDERRSLGLSRQHVNIEYATVVGLYLKFVALFEADNPKFKRAVFDRAAGYVQ